MKIAIIQYNAGNTQSVIFALNRLGFEPLLTDDFEQIQQADKVIFPGVGEASTTMQHLRQKGLDKLIPILKQPVLGICLGMQLMCRYSEENNTECLGIFDIDVLKFKSEYEKIPHMGWNNLTLADNALNKNLSDTHMYFVHSFYAPVGQHTISSANYIHDFSAALQKDNFYAVQFHPEKSSKQGLQLIQNFISL